VRAQPHAERQGQGDAALWLLAGLLALWSPPEGGAAPDHAPAPAQPEGLPPADELVPLYAMMRQVRGRGPRAAAATARSCTSRCGRRAERLAPQQRVMGCAGSLCL
jgi:hypothetical protein